MKQQLTVNLFRNKDIKKGDFVKIIDGSSLIVNRLPNKSFFIRGSYPELFGETKLLEYLEAKVITVDINDKFCSGVSSIIYPQDVVIEINGVRISLASRHLIKLDRPSGFRRGEKFIHDEDSVEYMLAQVATSSYCLISLVDGNRYVEAVRVEDHWGSGVGPQEWQDISQGNFTKISKED
tara:strand:+ start:203 stop:742 length:540 start_codon:yes stop_codon:yes gene_type:complete